MATVNIVITNKRTFSAPLGTVFGPYVYALTPKAGGAPLEITTPELSASFPNVPAADYSTHVRRVDANTGGTIDQPLALRDVLATEFISSGDLPSDGTITIIA